mmetsp:Transcript_23958/g.36249  ORF Transcript_23958/g.36249 Transcript_23958/m.36249 type:complete len:379 (+) Transcript_23958:117-1253(+)
MTSSSTQSSNMMMLLLVNGFTPSDLSSSLDKLKSQTKNLGTHKQREAYWNAYGELQSTVTKYSNLDVENGKLFGLVKYYRNMDDDDGGDDDDATTKIEFEPFTKRQRAIVNTPRLMMGRHIKLLVDDDEDEASTTGKEFIMPWFGDEAEMAYQDITSGEECISIDSDRGVFVSTRMKRKNCAASISPTLKKSVDALKEFVAKELQPKLQSISWQGGSIPSANAYNVILTGVWPTSVTQHLSESNISHCNTTSMHEIYDLFLERRNDHYITQAEELIARLLTEQSKNAKSSSMEYSVHFGSMKELACAKRNALLKKVYIDSSKTKFIENAQKEAQEDGGSSFELVVIEKRSGAGAGGKFEEYGGVVFETFYKVDLSIYG